MNNSIRQGSYLHVHPMTASTTNQPTDGRGLANVQKAHADFLIKACEVKAVLGDTSKPENGCSLILFGNVKAIPLTDNFTDVMLALGGQP